MAATSLDLIAELSNANGAPGFEDEVTAIIRKHTGGFCNIQEDPLRNLYLHRPQADPEKPVLMLEAHSDEVAFMVQFIQPKGMLNFLPLGGWPAPAVAAQKVRVMTKDGNYLPGIIGVKPPHFMSEEEKKKPLDVADMVIDVGASSSREVTEELGIEVGAPVVPDTYFEHPEGRDVFFGKAFDNRLGCAAVIEAMKLLKDRDTALEPVGVISSQEEVGTRGAQVSVRRINAAAGIIFEGSPADDSYGPEWTIQGGIGKGPQIRLLDRSMIANPRFIKYAKNIAQSMGMATQTTVRSGGGTDAARLHLSQKGVPAMVMGIPVRYAHTPHCISSLTDFKQAVDLSVEMASRMTEEDLSGF